MPHEKGSSVLDSVIDEVVRFYADGYSLTECGKRFGVSWGAARNALLKAGVTLRSYSDAGHTYKTKHPEWCQKESRLDEHREAVIAMYLSGISPKEIGARYGMSRVNVRAFLIANNVPPRSKSEAAKLTWIDPPNRKVATSDPGVYRVPESPAQQALFDFHSDEPKRRCSRCGHDVPMSKWGRKKARYYPSYCLRCSAEYKRENPQPIDDDTKAKYALARKKNRSIVRLEVLAAYGGRCECCQESREEFLCIDHIHGKGSDHRRHLNLQGLTSTHSKFLWLRRHGFPDGFRILCSSCNCAIAWSGYCPHQDPRDYLDVPYSVLWKRKIRLEVISGYGGRCGCCGESRPEFLAIDHVSGGGNRHHKKLRVEGVSYYAFLRSIVASGFPPDYRALCHSCNNSLGSRGYCPHERERSTSGKADAEVLAGGGIEP